MKTSTVLKALAVTVGLALSTVAWAVTQFVYFTPPYSYTLAVGSRNDHEIHGSWSPAAWGRTTPTPSDCKSDPNHYTLSYGLFYQTQYAYWQYTYVAIVPMPGKPLVWQLVHTDYFKDAHAGPLKLVRSLKSPKIFALNFPFTDDYIPIPFAFDPTTDFKVMHANLPPKVTRAMMAKTVYAYSGCKVFFSHYVSQMDMCNHISGFGMDAAVWDANNSYQVGVWLNDGP